jgi:hypothetical protein
LLHYFYSLTIKHSLKRICKVELKIEDRDKTIGGRALSVKDLKIENSMTMEER